MEALHRNYDNDKKKTLDTIKKIRNTIFLISRFYCLICKTYLIVKIRGEMYLKVNSSVKTQLHGYNRLLAPPYGPSCERFVIFMRFTKHKHNKQFKNTVAINL